MSKNTRRKAKYCTRLMKRNWHIVFHLRTQITDPLFYDLSKLYIKLMFEKIKEKIW